MSVGFGFSAGDFIAGLNLVKDVIDAMREAGGAATHYRDLLTELYSLETALLEVKRLDPDICRPAQLIALQQTASQCQRTIDEFWKKISKFQPHLRIGGSGSKVKDGWKKVQWALCRKEDVDTLRAKLTGHTASINIFLMTMQMKNVTMENRNQENRHQSLASQVQQGFFAILHRLKCIGSGVNSLIETTANIMRTNTQVFQMVLNIQALITRLPGQIERQQPVYFTDAFGKIAPFHLEFITSPEAFMAVLKVRHRHAGADKIARREFFLQETSTAQEINIQDSWDTCFQPGQEVDMSMVFDGQISVGNTCPACLHDCDNCISAKNVLCPSCKRTFSRISAVNKKAPQLPLPEIDPTSVPMLGIDPEKRKQTSDDIEEITRFRRVRIVSYYEAMAELNRSNFHKTLPLSDDALQMMTTNTARANKMLMNAGIHPGLLSRSQLESFHSQQPHVQYKAVQVYALNMAQQTRQNMPQPGMLNQGSPMMQSGLDVGARIPELYAANAAGQMRGLGPMPQGPGATGNHALQDYQMQLMLLEQQNKKRLLMAKQEQENGQPMAGQPGFVPGMLPT